MKKIPTFTLVRRPFIDMARLTQNRGPAAKNSGTETALVIAPSATKSGMTNAIRESIESTELVKVFDRLDPPFKETLLSSFANPTIAAKESATSSRALVNDNLVKITSELARHERVLRVGVLDLGAWIGKLPILLEELNAAQPLFTIFELQAPIPGGLLKTPEGMAEWASERLNRPLTEEERIEFEGNMIADDFFNAAEDIREEMGLDFIVGITAAMVAGVSSNCIYWNHFSSLSGRTILLSAADLRHFAEQAERPFEVAIGALLVASLLIAVNDKLDYHDDSGCLFDYNGSRISLVETIKALCIEDKCLEKMTSEQSKAAVDMLSALKRMRR